jgi:hypothetical protein
MELGRKAFATAANAFLIQIKKFVLKNEKMYLFLY